jgi:hypothetical protein
MIERESKWRLQKTRAFAFPYSDPTFNPRIFYGTSITTFEGVDSKEQYVVSIGVMDCTSAFVSFPKMDLDYITEEVLLNQQINNA